MLVGKWLGKRNPEMNGIKYLLAVPAIAALFVSQAIAQNQSIPIDVRVGEWAIEIESIVEKINIFDVLVTDGSCQAILKGSADTNLSLGFGDVKKVILLGRNGYDCVISEIEVVTDQGTYAFRH